MCEALRLLEDISSKMYVFDEAIAIINGVIERRERDRLRKQTVRGHVHGQKENEEGKEKLSPTPPIREKEEGKESRTAEDACAREKLPPVLDVNCPPSLELLLAFAHLRCNFFDDNFTREWYRIMNDEYAWKSPDDGKPIHHWPSVFRLWRANRKKINALRKPSNAPDHFMPTRHADNWRGTKKEDIEHVF